jgi:chaperone required for assembly of F1-ATPase
MREIFADIFENQPLDPTEAARQAVRPRLRKRFYKQAQLSDAQDGVGISLDGRPVLTPRRRAFVAPTRPLAAAIAAEWDAQSETIDPRQMPLTRLANAVIDAVSENPEAVAEEITKYLGSDLLFYRAETPKKLVDRQSQAWDPVLAWARGTFGANFKPTQGVVHVTQPAEAVEALQSVIPRDPWRLAAVSSVTTVTGSALLALAIAQGAIDVDTAWAAAHVDEDWQMTQWGRDELALERRAYREAEFRAAASVLNLVG